EILGALHRALRFFGKFVEIHTLNAFLVASFVSVSFADDGKSNSNLGAEPLAAANERDRFPSGTRTRGDRTSFVHRFTFYRNMLIFNYLSEYIAKNWGPSQSVQTAVRKVCITFSAQVGPGRSRSEHSHKTTHWRRFKRHNVSAWLKNGLVAVGNLDTISI
ncbi:MAG: hypothetical protein ACI8QF_004706, partial [Limisphaerales bacterium]